MGSVELATDPAGQPEPAKVNVLIKTEFGSGPTSRAVGAANVRAEAARRRTVLKYIMNDGLGSLRLIFWAVEMKDMTVTEGCRIENRKL